MMREQDGMPVLQFIFDLTGFEPEDVSVDVGAECLTLTAYQRSENDDEALSKTKIRKFDIPENVIICTVYHYMLLPL